ncbi:MAG: hypothetical protein HYS98_00250 [Deltaproteobacteria bacterium]|nr:hypothetical protein [Deltaproteobacteria bacterium]
MKERNILRQDSILDQIIGIYLITGEPVGSRILAKKQTVALSPASIRNIMSDLEDQGLLCQPHTSAGRIPSASALKQYVSRLLEKRQEQNKFSGSSFVPSFDDREDLMEYVSYLLGNRTRQTSFIAFPQLQRKRQEKKLFYSCQSHILNHPEFSNLEIVRKIFMALDDREEFLQKIEKWSWGLNVYIGSENLIEGLEECSVISSTYENSEGAKGYLGVIGPQRMDYENVINEVKFGAETLSRTLNKEGKNV